MSGKYNIHIPIYLYVITCELLVQYVTWYANTFFLCVLHSFVGNKCFNHDALNGFSLFKLQLWVLFKFNDSVKKLKEKKMHILSWNAGYRFTRPLIDDNSVYLKFQNNR